jgi:hypothetical protein
MEGSSTPIHASTVSDQPMSTAITTIETTTGSTAGNANDDGIMLSDISEECMILDDDGIMLSDISGKWLLLDADGMT